MSGCEGGRVLLVVPTTGQARVEGMLRTGQPYITLVRVDRCWYMVALRILEVRSECLCMRAVVWMSIGIGGGCSGMCEYGALFTLTNPGYEFGIISSKGAYCEEAGPLCFYS